MAWSLWGGRGGDIRLLNALNRWYVIFIAESFIYLFIILILSHPLDQFQVLSRQAAIYIYLYRKVRCVFQKQTYIFINIYIRLFLKDTSDLSEAALGGRCAGLNVISARGSSN